MNLFFKRVLNAVIQDALSLAPAARIPHIRKAVSSSQDFSSLSHRQREDMIREASGVATQKEPAKAKAKAKTKTTKRSSKK